MSKHTSSIQLNSVTLLVFLLTILWLLLRWPEPTAVLVDADGGHQLSGANQILFGEHPFLDWHTTFGPLRYYPSALAQWITGKRLIGEVFLTVLGYALGYVILFRLSRQISQSTGMALALTFLALILLPRMYKFLIILCPMLTLWAAWNYIHRPTWARISLLALTMTIVGLFRVDFGLYTALCGLTAVILCPAPKHLIRLQRASMLIIFSLFWALPWFIWLWFGGGISNYIYDMLLAVPRHGVGETIPFPTFRFHEAFTSAPNSLAILFLFFFAVPLVSVITLIKRRHQLPVETQVKLACTIMLALASLIQASRRSDYPHLVQSIPASYILCAWLTAAAKQYFLSATHWQQIWLGVSLIVPMSVVGLSIVTTTAWPSFNFSTLSEKLGVYAGSREDFLSYVAQKSPEHPYLEAVRYIRRCAPPSQRITALMGLASLNYLADRPFGGQQPFINAAFLSTSADQIRMIQSISTEKVVLILYLPDWAMDGREDRKLERFAPILIDYLKENFSPIKQFGPISVYAQQSLIIITSPGF